MGAGTDGHAARRFPSGPWTGYYQREGRRRSQDLELVFEGGVIRGGGWDDVGEFVVKGSYDDDTGEARWTKIYGPDRKITCRGFREGKGIWGTWQLEGHKGAGFHVWPLEAGDSEPA